MSMKVGTKSLLFGAHQFLLHPVFVAIAWIKLYGYPRDIRIWFSFLFHDLGYWGQSNMDGPEGETHPVLGAVIMNWLFDKECEDHAGNTFNMAQSRSWTSCKHCNKWYFFTLYHSRFYAKSQDAQISKLCIADKYAFCIPPRWLYLLLASASGEIWEYMYRNESHDGSKKDWYRNVYYSMVEYVAAHKDKLNDTVTEKRHN
jgi:hypothetical protein